MSLFTCLHPKKINEKPLVGKNYRLNSSSWGRTKNYGFSHLFSAKRHKNIYIFMTSIRVWWVSNAPYVWTFPLHKWKKNVYVFSACRSWNTITDFVAYGKRAWKKSSFLRIIYLSNEIINIYKVVITWKKKVPWHLIFSVENHTDFYLDPELINRDLKCASLPSHKSHSIFLFVALTKQTFFHAMQLHHVSGNFEIAQWMKMVQISMKDFEYFPQYQIVKTWLMRFFFKISNVYMLQPLFIFELETCI